ncbi:chromatin binding protein [Gaertneriomyces sp. JEL0708]|nr:chromatin binding protein [Gaertneriomyces sp. JEL0708]
MLHVPEVRDEPNSTRLFNIDPTIGLFSDPYGQHHAEIISDTLVDSKSDGAVCCQFSYKGNLLAAGSSSGMCSIWDMGSRRVARRLKGHVQTVTSIRLAELQEPLTLSPAAYSWFSWDRSGRYLVTASADYRCLVWDLKDGNQKRAIPFDTPLALVRVGSSHRPSIAALTQSGTFIYMTFSEDDFGGALEVLRLQNFADPEGHLTEAIEKEKVTALCFAPGGTILVLGTSRGFLIVLDVSTMQVQSAQRVVNSGIRTLQTDRKGCDLVLSANDRTIRVYTIESEQGIIEVTNEQKFSDYVETSPWAQGALSADGQYVIGGSAGSKNAHHIYLWNRHLGNLIKRLEGEMDGLLDLVAHPLIPMLASVGASGAIYIWTPNYRQTYSALAPDFTELSDNEEYEERESEFDEQETPPKPINESETNDEDVDVAGITALTYFDDTGTPGAFVLPLTTGEPATEDEADEYWEWRIDV